MNGKETLLKMISQSEACGCNRKMRVQCSHSLLVERVKSLDNVSAPSFIEQLVIFKEKQKQKKVLIHLNLSHFYMHDHRIMQTALLFSFYNNFVKDEFQLQERLNKLNASHTSFCGNEIHKFINSSPEQYKNHNQILSPEHCSKQIM